MVRSRSSVRFSPSVEMPDTGAPAIDQTQRGGGNGGGGGDAKDGHDHGAAGDQAGQTGLTGDTVN